VGGGGGVLIGCGFVFGGLVFYINDDLYSEMGFQ